MYSKLPPSIGKRIVSKTSNHVCKLSMLTRKVTVFFFSVDDFNRVMLKPSAGYEESCDYINASYINVC